MSKLGCVIYRTVTVWSRGTHDTAGCVEWNNTYHQTPASRPAKITLRVRIQTLSLCVCEMFKYEIYSCGKITIYVFIKCLSRFNVLKIKKNICGRKLSFYLNTYCTYCTNHFIHGSICVCVSCFRYCKELCCTFGFSSRICCWISLCLSWSCSCLLVCASSSCKTTTLSTNGLFFKSWFCTNNWNTTIGFEGNLRVWWTEPPHSHEISSSPPFLWKTQADTSDMKPKREMKSRRGVSINHILIGERFLMKHVLSSVVHLFLQLFIFSRHVRFMHH